MTIQKNYYMTQVERNILLCQLLRDKFRYENEVMQKFDIFFAPSRNHFVAIGISDKFYQKFFKVHVVPNPFGVRVEFEEIVNDDFVDKNMVVAELKVLNDLEASFEKELSLSLELQKVYEERANYSPTKPDLTELKVDDLLDLLQMAVAMKDTEYVSEIKQKLQCLLSKEKHAN